MSILKSMKTEEQKTAGVLESWRKKAARWMTSGQSDEAEDNVFDVVEDAFGDACKFVRRSVSQAAQSLSEIGGRQQRMSSSYNDRATRSASPSAGRLNSEVSPEYNGGNARRSPGADGRLSSVSVGASPAYDEETAFGTIRRKASSALSSIKSLLPGDQVNASADREEEVAEIARKYTDGQANGNSDWTTRLAGNQKKFSECNVNRKQAEQTSFTIKHNGNAGGLEIGFLGKEDFLRSIQSLAGEHITVKVSLSPGENKVRKIHLQKKKTRYMHSTTQYRDIGAADVDGKTLSLAIMSQKKPWKKTRMLWQQSVSLKGLSTSKTKTVYWKE